MKCKEKDCKGELQTKKPIKLRISCEKSDIAYSCIACGRLYWPSGEPIFNRSDEKPYWNWERERIENRDSKGNIMDQGTGKSIQVMMELTLNQYKTIRNIASMTGKTEKAAS